MFRYWLDLHRNGQVVRQEDFLAGDRGREMVRRLDIKLAPFKVGKDEVWMPVSGESVGYAATVDKKPVIMKEPQAFDKTYVVNGTTEFSKHLSSWPSGVGGRNGPAETRTRSQPGEE